MTDYNGGPVPNREALLAWVERLESGVDVQGRAGLCQAYEDGTKQMCCLGVVTDQNAELLGLEVKTTPSLSPNDDGSKFSYTLWDGEGATLPAKVRDYLGLSQSNFSVTDPYTGTRRPIASLNDQGRTFPELAAAIRAEFDL